MDRDGPLGDNLDRKEMKYGRLSPSVIRLPKVPALTGYHPGPDLESGAKWVPEGTPESVL